MENIDKIGYIIFGYLNKEYQINDFCDLYIEYYEELDTEMLPDSFKKFLSELSDLCYRFADAPEDLALPNVYYSENDILEYLEKFSKNWHLLMESI